MTIPPHGHPGAGGADGTRTLIGCCSSHSGQAPPQHIPCGCWGGAGMSHRLAGFAQGALSPLPSKGPGAGETPGPAALALRVPHLEGRGPRPGGCGAAGGSARLPWAPLAGGWTLGYAGSHSAPCAGGARESATPWDGGERSALLALGTPPGTAPPLPPQPPSFPALPDHPTPCAAPSRGPGHSAPHSSAHGAARPRPITLLTGSGHRQAPPLHREMVNDSQAAPAPPYLQSLLGWGRRWHGHCPRGPFPHVLAVARGHQHLQDADTQRGGSRDLG